VLITGPPVRRVTDVCRSCSLDPTRRSYVAVPFLQAGTREHLVSVAEYPRFGQPAASGLDRVDRADRANGGHSFAAIFDFSRGIAIAAMSKWVATRSATGLEEPSLLHETSERCLVPSGTHRCTSGHPQFFVRVSDI